MARSSSNQSDRMENKEKKIYCFFVHGCFLLFAGGGGDDCIYYGGGGGKGKQDQIQIVCF